MPKKSQKQPVNYDIVEINDYQDDSENEAPVKKPSKIRQSQKKQVKKPVSESEEEEAETEEEEEEQPKAPRKKALPKGKVEVPVKTKIMSEARLKALAKGREIARQRRTAKKEQDLEALKQKLWSEFEQTNGKAKATPKAKKQEDHVQQSIDDVKKMMPKLGNKQNNSFYEPSIIIDFRNRKK